MVIRFCVRILHIPNERFGVRVLCMPAERQFWKKKTKTGIIRVKLKAVCATDFGKTSFNHTQYRFKTLFIHFYRT